MLKAENSIFLHHAGERPKTAADVLGVIKASAISHLLPVFVAIAKILGVSQATSCLLQCKNKQK